jgi:hypothetical protein
MMASEKVLAVRRVQAIEDQARELSEVNRKLDLIMKALKIEDAPVPKASPAPVPPVEEPEQQEPEGVEPEAPGQKAKVAKKSA